MKTLVIHVSHIDSTEFDFFVKHALFQSDDVTFVLVRNDPNVAADHFAHVTSRFSNVRVLIRPNVGHDFQGWNEALFFADYTQFDRFIFVNATVSGPYLPSYVKENWVNCFTSNLTDTVKLVGLSVNHVTTYLIQPGYLDLIRKTYGINVTNSSHVQSMIFATDIIGLNVLMRKCLFKRDKTFPADKVELIILHEIAMSTILFDAGYSVFGLIKAPGQGVVTPQYAEEIFRTKSKDVAYDDPWLIDRFQSTLCECMFIKICRGIVFPERSRYDNWAESTYVAPVPRMVADVVVEKPDWVSAPDFGFIILRHVKDANTNRYWQRAYMQIRQFHSEPILIIDDNSDPAYLTPLTMTNCQVITGGWPGRGEILPYYHFHRLRLWKKAVFIHDSVFINTRINAMAVDDVKFLWYFPNHLARLEQTPQFLRQLQRGDELVAKYASGTLDWVGCFGGMSVIDWQFLDKLVQKYNIFTLLSTITTREHRMNWERVFGLVCCQTKLDLATNPSMFGYFGTLLSGTGDDSYENYLRRGSAVAVSKVFTGR